METPTREQGMSNAFDTLFQNIVGIEAIPEKETPRRRGSNNKRPQDKFLQTVSSELKNAFEEKLRESNEVREILARLDRQQASQKTKPTELINKIPKKSIEDERSRLEAIFNEEKQETDALESTLKELEELKQIQLIKAKQLRENLEKGIKMSNENNKKMKKWMSDQVY